MSIDETRREDGVGTIQPLFGSVTGIDFRFSADGEDAVSADYDGAIFDHAALGILGDDVAGAPDPVGGLRGKGGSNNATKNAGKNACATATKMRHRMVSGTSLSCGGFRSCRA